MLRQLEKSKGDSRINTSSVGLFLYLAHTSLLLPIVQEVVPLCKGVPSVPCMHIRGLAPTDP